MDIFEYSDELRYGELHLKSIPEIGLHAIVAIHNLKFGPAIGGTRFLEYDRTDDALFDVMRLARGMTYKAAISNLPHGGGKAVIIRPKNLGETQREEIFAEFGKFVGSLNGKYITCEDSGTTVGDMSVIKRHTDSVLGYDPEDGSSGDPSPLTALGVRRGIQAAAKFKYGRDDLQDLRVAIQGVGHVGYYLARELHELGVQLTVADINQESLDRCVSNFGAKVVAPEAIYEAECDIFAPCALGAVINDQTIKQFKCDIIAGASNNQVLEARHGAELKERGILYTPDYALNAGGLINVAHEYVGYDADKVREEVMCIYDTMLNVFERAASDDVPTDVVADRIVEEKLYS